SFLRNKTLGVFDGTDFFTVDLDTGQNITHSALDHEPLNVVYDKTSDLLFAITLLNETTICAELNVTTGAALRVIVDISASPYAGVVVGPMVYLLQQLSCLLEEYVFLFGEPNINVFGQL